MPTGPMADLSKQDRERRTNHALRTLIDEMLDRVRQLHRNTTIWDAADRAQAEAELAEIMARVRMEATAPADDAAEEPAAAKKDTT